MHIHKYVVACVAHVIHTHKHNKPTKANVTTNKPKISKPYGPQCLMPMTQRHPLHVQYKSQNLLQKNINITMGSIYLGLNCSL
jgi:hypothetical protein